MANAPEPPRAASDLPPQADAAPPQPAPEPARVHEVRFVAYPKLLFAWPLILAGYILYPFAAPPAAMTAPAGPGPATVQPASEPVVEPGAPPAPVIARRTSDRLEIIAWIYIWVLVLVLIAIGVDVDRNQAIFLGVLVLLIYFLGLWLRDTRHFTLFGDIYRWFTDLDVQYDRRFGFVLSVLITVPYLLMLILARLNDRWRITHNEFEHYSFGKMSDSLGRGAKSIRTQYPDVFEALLGAAGTLVVFNSTGTRELRRIAHVPLLPVVVRRLSTILESTAVTTAMADDEEDEV